MGCKMTKAIKKQRAKTNKKDDETSSIIQDLSQVDIMSLNRRQLQTLCKERGLKANGKTTELQEKLKSYKPPDVNNNITSAEENEAFEDKKMKENIPQTDDNLQQSSDTSKACPQKTISKTTRSKTLEKQKNTAVGERDKDGRKERKKGRGKVKTEKKSSGSKNEKNEEHVTEEKSVTRTDDKHLVDDDDRFVIRGRSVSSTEDVDLRTNESRAIQESQSATCCTRWCVVEGIPKHDSEISWKRIKLKGGRPVVPNRFGKHIPFVLEPSNIDVPCDFRDNYICGLCVRDNERLNGERGGTNVALTTRKDLQRPVSQGSESQNASDDENKETPLSSFTRGEGIRASVKRKRLEDHSPSTTENLEEEECWVLRSKRQRSSLLRSTPGIPASPVARKARGEKLNLPRNHKKAWRPKKASRSTSPLQLAEDASFAQKVEAIIKSTVPGSEEELIMIMSRNSRVQRSPIKPEQN